MSDRTEAPTPRRRQEARERGEIARSPELNTAVGLIVAFALLKSVGPAVSDRLGAVLADLLSQSGSMLESPETLRTLLLGLTVPIGLSVAPFAVGLMAAGFASSAVQVGFNVSSHYLKPNWGRLNPLAGLKRMFSSQSLVELGKQILKVTLIGFIAYSALQGKADGFMALSRMELRASVYFLWTTVGELGTRVGMVMLVLALADYAYQRRQHDKKLRMTKQEVIEEMKRYENPFIRSRIRQQQRRMAMQRMMAAVPTADVVITNPTHLAVALKYDGGKMGAPVVVAKGQRLVAERIRDLARANGVPLVERRPLAQALFKMVVVGMEVPEELYQAVAEVLAFIYGLKAARR